MLKEEKIRKYMENIEKHYQGLFTFGKQVNIQKQLDVRDSIFARYSPRVLDPETGEEIEVTVPSLIPEALPPAPDPDHIDLDLFKDNEDDE